MELPSFCMKWRGATWHQNLRVFCPVFQDGPCMKWCWFFHFIRGMGSSIPYRYSQGGYIQHVPKDLQQIIRLYMSLDMLNMTQRYSSVDRTSNTFPIKFPLPNPMELMKPRYFWHWNPAASKAFWNFSRADCAVSRHRDVFSMTNRDPGGESRKQRRARSSISLSPKDFKDLNLRSLKSKTH